MTQYNELTFEQLKPGTLCTVLGIRRRKPRHSPVGDVALISTAPVMDPISPFMGWPLRVKYTEPGNPYVVLEVLDRPGRPHGYAPLTNLDSRRFRLCRITDEYRRQFLGEQYVSTMLR